MRISSFVDRGRVFDKFLIAILIYMIGGFPTLVYALPQGGTIASGAGTIDTSGSALTVTQTTNKIIINWESFSIGNNESVIFLQPDSTSSALNNVLGTSRTVVEGNLLANGQIVLSNPNGIFLSPNANIDVAGLIASTLKISEQDFLDGLYKFSQDSSKPLASILNEGKIRASDFAALIAPSVDNKGVVIANLGTVGLVSGKAATVDFVGDNLIKFTVNAPVEGQVLDKNGNLISDRISNSGSIQANGGQVILSAKNASSIIQDVINVEGLITAKTVTKKNGLIVISGGNQGNVNVAGTLDASGEKPGDQGGNITVAGASVTVAEGSIQAKGTDAKGGNITINGTDWVNAGSTMDVSGETGGNVNITTGGLSLAAPVLAKGTTGQGGNININTLFKSWEVVSALLDVSGASGGTIKHFAGQEITTSGEYLAIGAAGAGGSIDVTANTLKFMSNTIDASGTMGGGSIRLGGEYQGGKNLVTDEILNAKFLFMTDAANITARTTGTDGAGGRVIAWADQYAFVSGHFDVRPGTQTGAGGFVEVSSADILAFDGSVRASVDDRKGTLLLDPKSITIKGEDGDSGDGCQVGFGNSDECKGAAMFIANTGVSQNYGQSVSIASSVITDVLDAGTDVGLQAYRDITISHALVVDNSGNGGDLSLKAGRRITIDENIAIDTDNGDLTLTANDCTGTSDCNTGNNRRSTGTGYIWMKSGSSIDTGTGDFTATVGTASDSDNIILATVRANDLTVTNSGTSADSDVNLGASTVDGNLSVTATTGTITDSGVLTVTGAATINAGSNAVTLDNGNAFSGALTLTSAALELGATTVGGALSVTASGAVTDTGVLTVTGTSSFTTSTDDALITLDSTNLFTGAVSLSTAGTTGDVTVVNAGDLIFAASTILGDLIATASGDGDVTQTGALTILGTTDITATGNDVTLNLASNDFDSDDNGDTGRLVTITGRNVNIQNSDSFNLGAQTISGNLTVQAGANGEGNGNIDDGGALDVEGTTTLTATNYVNMNDNGSDYTGPVNVTAEGGKISLKDENSIELGTISTVGNFTVVASRTGTPGTVTQSGTITVTKRTTITNTGGDVTLEAEANDFGDGNASYNTDLLVTAATVSIKNADTLELGASTVSDTYTVTAITGDIIDTGTLAITRLATFNTSTAGADITLNETGSTFAAGVSLNTNGTSGHATIDTGTNALDLATSSVSGDLTLTSGHASGITDSGTVTVGGDLSATTDANNGVITLNNLAVDTDGGSTIAFAPNGSGSVTIVNDDGINFAASTIGGVLTTDDTDALTVGETITTNSISGVVILGANGSNSVTYTGTARHQTSGAIFAAGGTITGGTSGNTRVISASGVANGTLTATATTGNITQSGALKITGTSSFTTSGPGADITLQNTSNNFFEGVSFNTTADIGTTTGGNVAVKDATDFYLGASTINGNLEVESGDVTKAVIGDDGIVTVTGTTDLSASGTNNNSISSIWMDDFSHVFSDAISAQGHHVNMKFGGATELGTIRAKAGNIVITSSGALTQSGPMQARNDTTITASGQDITLNNTSNSFGGNNNATITSTNVLVGDEIILTGANVEVASDHSFNVGTSTVTGNLTLTSGSAENGAGTYGIIDTGDVSVGANFSATTTANNGAIDMLDLEVDGTIGLTTHGTGNATIENDDDIDFATSSIGGNLNATAAASTITDATGAVLTVGGTSTFVTNANNATITLDQGGHAFTGALLITTNDNDAAPNDTGGDVTISAGSAVALDFGASTIDGDLIATSSFNPVDSDSNGTISETESNGIIDSGVVTVRGTSSFQTTGAGANISLGTSTLGDGTGTDTITLNTAGSGGDATLDNVTTIVVLGTSAASLATSVGGNLTLQTGHASGITDSATVTVGGRFYATTDLNNGVINMGTLNILDGGTIKLDTHGNGDATVVNTCTTCNVGLAFETSTIRGDLIAKADSGNIENVLGNTLTVSLTSSFQTVGSGADITLNQTNALSGEVTLNTTGSGGDVTLNSGTTALQLGTSAVPLATSVSGNLVITAGAAVTDLDGLTVAGTTSINADNAGTKQNVTLDHTSNDFTGAVSVIGAAVQLVDANAIDLGTTTTTGTYQVTATALGDITDSGTLTIGNAATFTAAAGRSIYLDNLDASNNLTFGIHTFSGAVTFATPSGSLLNVTVRNSAAFDFGAALTLAQVSSAGGNLILTAGGNVTQTGGALTVPGTTTVSAAGNTVTLSNSSNNFTGAVSINALTVDLEDANAIVLGASTVTGNYAVEAGTTITQSAELAITGVTTLKAGAGNNITLDNTSNNFLNAVKITRGTNVTLVDADTIDLGTSTVSGTYAVTAKLGNITQSGNLTVTNASTFETEALSGTILCGNPLCTSAGGTNAFSGTVKLTTTGSSGHAYIDNGTTALEIANDTSVGGNLTLVSGHASGITDAGTLTVGGNLYATTDANNGVINLGGLDMSATTSKIQLTTHNNGAATVVNTKHLHFISADVGGNFIATATDGTITQDSAFDIDGTSDFHSVSADNIILDSAANDFTGDVRFRGGAVVIKDTNDIEFGGGDSTAADTLADSNGNQYALKIYAGDRITDDNTIPSNLKVTGGNAWFGTNNNDADRIVLDSASNVFSGTLTMVGGIGHTVNSSAAVVLTAMTLAGDLRVTTTGGTVTDTGVLSVEGLTVISASGFDVTLDGDGTTYNNFQDEVQIVGANVVIKDTNNIELGKSTVSGTYDVTAGGTVTQNQLTANPLAITGVSTITGTDITLNNTANNFIAAIGVNTIGSDVVLVDTNAIVLGASTVSGTYSVTAGGAVTQAASTVLDIEGITTIEAGGHVVTLTNASNDFTSAVGVTGTTVQVTDTNDLDLGATTTTGAYTVIAGGGITDSGALTIGTTASAQTASFTAGNGEAIILDHVNATSDPVHDFSGGLTFAASSGNLAGLTVYAVDAIALAALTLVAAGGGDLAGNLSLKSGTVTQAGAWVVPGTTTVSSSGSDVTLSNTSNDFGGAVSVTGVDVMLVDANAIDLGASTVTGNYAVTATAGGGITDSGALNVTGTSTFTAAGGQSIILDESSTFTSAVTFASGGTLVGVSITDSTDFDLQALTLTGNLVVASGGSITQSGNLTIGGTSSFTTSSTNETITLSDASSTNAFTGAFTLSSTGTNAHVTIDNGTTAIDIASASVGGNLTLTSGAAAGITDSGPVTVAGNLIAITDANNGVIDMGTLAVDGSISLTTHGTGNATIINDAGLNFATSTVGGDLNATATTLNIADSGTLTVTGATIITLGTNPILVVAGARTATDINGNTITLDTANNLFTGGITLRYDNVAPPDDNSDIYLASQVAFAELLFAIDQNITKIYGSYGEMQDHLLWMYKLFRDSFPRQEQFLEVDRQPQPNQVKLRKIKTNTKKNNASEGKRL